MRFRIDIIYIALQALKAIIGYFVGIMIVLYFRDFADIWDIVVPSLCAAIILFVIFMIPKSIIVKDGIISFTKENHHERVKVKLTEIIRIETNTYLYNTLTIFTKAGKKYRLHPEDLQAMESILSNWK